MKIFTINIVAFINDKLINFKDANRSYKEVASALFVSEETVKSFFSRKKIKDEEIYVVCKNCGVSLEKRSGSKKFCSDLCRYKWWRENAENNRKCVKINICKNCEKKFKSYDNKERKYCSHACYTNHRFKKQKGKSVYDKRAI